MYLTLSQETNTSVVSPCRGCLSSTTSEYQRVQKFITCEGGNCDKGLRRYENGGEEMGRCKSPLRVMWQRFLLVCDRKGVARKRDVKRCGSDIACDVTLSAFSQRHH